MRQEVRGDGWARRLRDVPETIEEELERNRAVMEENEKAAEGKSSFFGSVTHNIREFCQNVVDGHSDQSFLNRTPVDCSRQVLNFLESADKAIAAGDASHAAHMALLAAREFTFFELRHAYESDSIRGAAVIEGLRKNAAARYAEGHDTKVRRLDRMRQLVPKLSVRAAARKCEQEGLGNAGTVRQTWNRHIAKISGDA